MPTCEVCGNDYDEAMEISLAGGPTRTFDSFERAIHAITPRCAHCGIAIIGHGHEAGGSMYCCAHCARESGHAELADRDGD